MLKYRLKTPVIHHAPEICREMMQVILQNYINREDDTGHNIIAVKGALYTLCSFFYEQLDFSTEEKNPAERNELLERIFQYVESNVGNPCSLSVLAQTLGYSAAYISRFFSENVGVTYHEYVRNVKINHACFLLDSTKERVLDISSMCGYTSLASFNRSFKQATGRSPTEYRDMGPNRSKRKK